MSTKCNRPYSFYCLIAAALLVSSGCATIFKGKYSDIDIDSKPPTKVYINGVYAGRTPLMIQLASNQTYTIEFKRDGYETKAYHLGHRIGKGWFILDCFTIYGLIVDFVTGAWYIMDEYDVNVELDTKKTRFPKKQPTEQPHN